MDFGYDEVPWWRSWEVDEGIVGFDEVLGWVQERNEATHVEIGRIPLAGCAPWFYDEREGCIRNGAGSFFRVVGARQVVVDPVSGGERIAAEQPAILQDEIGFLGIIAKEFDGVVHLLMQAKIEPGNVNKVQVSPTIQATRSNFLRLHGGRRPAYLEHFLSPRHHVTIVDQVQSEQSSRFLGKRNRNVVLLAGSDVEVLPTHKWVTIGQLKRLMGYDNLVNMDTRTVLSCLPWFGWDAGSGGAPFLEGAFAASLARRPSLADMPEAFHMLNDYKTLSGARLERIPLTSLEGWTVGPESVEGPPGSPFRVVFCDIAIEGREVRRWSQPLFEATGRATFVLATGLDAGVRKALVRVRPEFGCFDGAEFGPTAQVEPEALPVDTAEEKTLRLLDSGRGVARDVVLSEEGGRFYCEQNRNVVLDVGDIDASPLCVRALPPGYLWLDLATLGALGQANNVLNIQLRNLLSLLDFRR